MVLAVVNYGRYRVHCAVDFALDACREVLVTPEVRLRIYVKTTDVRRSRVLGVPVALLSTWLTCGAGVTAALALLICDRLAVAASSAAAVIPSSDDLSFTTFLLSLPFTYKALPD